MKSKTLIMRAKDHSNDLSASSSSANKHVWMAATVAGLGGLLFGYDTGIIASALLFIRDQFELSSFEQGVVVSIVPLGAAAGALIAGRLSDRLGRKKVILGGAVLFVCGSIVSAISGGVLVLVAARAALGLAIGLASAIAPVYVSEIAPTEIRGRLITLFQLAITVGILVAYLVGLAFESSEGWRWMLGLGALPALLLFFGVARAPISPRWLVLKGRNDEARAQLAELRPGDQVEGELEAITKELSEQRESSWRDLMKPAAKAALFVGVGLAILQQVTGINTVIYYAPTIFQFTGIDSASAAIGASLAVGVVNVAMTVVAVRLLDRSGRRKLLLVGVAGMSISLFTLGAAFAGQDESTLTAVVAIASLMTYIASFAVSLGGVFWVLNAEIYPTLIRSRAASVGTMANWLFNFLVSLTFLTLIAELGRSGTFWLYGAIGVFTWFFCHRFVPETKDKPLEEITEIFEERARR